MDQREDVVAFELLAAVQEVELDHECEPHDLAPELLDEVDLRPGRPSGREQVVVDQDARTLRGARLPPPDGKGGMLFYL